MRTYHYLSLAFFSWPCLAVNLAAQATPPQSMTAERSIGADVADSMATLDAAERIDDTETLLLGLKSEFLSVRKVAAVALAKKSRDGALRALVDAYEANQPYVTGGTENQLMQREINAALASAMDKILNPGRTHAGLYSKDETIFLIESAKRELAKDATPGGASGGLKGPAPSPNAGEFRPEPAATDIKAGAPIEAHQIPLATGRLSIGIWTALGVLLMMGVFFWTRRPR